MSSSAQPHGAARRLDDLLRASAERAPEALAMGVGDARISYGALDALSNRLARAFAELGVGPGDRVGVWLPKSIPAVAAMQAALRLGAAYVPLDPLAPPLRVDRVLGDCGVKLLFCADSAALRRLSVAPPAALLLDGRGDDDDDDDGDDDGAGDGAGDTPSGVPTLSLGDVDGFDARPLERRAARADELAYVLYTSGSTGSPKGVCVGHGAALAFVRWAIDRLQAQPRDRFANHAPFHFDLSVLDIYAALGAGASLWPVDGARAFDPLYLVRFIERVEPTVWYSVPSALVLMIEYGELLEREREHLRAVLFAGESFPMTQLRRLRERWPQKRMLNLYGPTETNVCTAYELPPAVEADAAAIPIGRAVCGDELRVVDASGADVGAGGEGELLVSGPTVMHGYWGSPPQRGPYATGDIVRVRDDGDLVFVGRRDAMVKVRGHRIELGDIEAALVEHPGVTEAAAVVIGSGLEAKIVGALVLREGHSAPLLAVKKTCAERLPRTMIVDRVRVVEQLPRTSNGKVDRRRLAEQLALAPPKR